MSKFESSIKIIPFSREKVYYKISDLTNLESVKDKIPQDKVLNLSFDKDSLSFDISPVGQISLSIVDREPDKCVKFQSDKSPVPFNLWIQLVPLEEDRCKIKLTMDAELNPFIKSMVQKPLQEGLEKLADVLAGVDY